MSLMESGELQKANDTVKEKLWPTMNTCWSIWPFIIGGNLYFTPLAYQYHVVCLFSIGWNMYLCSELSKKTKIDVNE